MHCQMFRDILGLYPGDASSSPLPCPVVITTRPLRVKSLLVRTIGLHHSFFLRSKVLHSGEGSGVVCNGC